MRIVSPRKTCHHLKERRSVVFCLQFHITNLVRLKCQKLVRTTTKLKEKLKVTHRHRKIPFSSIHMNTLRYRFKKYPLWRAFSKSCVFSHRFHRVCVDDKKVAFSVWTGSNTQTTFINHIIAIQSTRSTCPIV